MLENLPGSTLNEEFKALGALSFGELLSQDFKYPLIYPDLPILSLFNSAL